MKGIFTRDLSLIDAGTMEDKFRRIAVCGPIAIFYFETHPHTGNIAIRLCDDLGLSYKLVRANVADASIGGLTVPNEEDLAGLPPEVVGVFPYDPFCEIYGSVASRVKIVRAIDLTFDVDMSKLVESEPITRGTAQIEEVLERLADESSRRTFQAIVTSRWARSRAWIMPSDYGCYFHPEVYRRQPRWIADCGAFRGETMRAFTAAYPQARVVAFEPETTNYEHLARNREADPALVARVELIKAGVWSKTLRANITSNGQASRVVETGEGPGIDLVSLDEAFANRSPPDMIKMDVEGAEMEALRGASGIIAKHRPILLISLYHHPEDLWEIPLLVDKLSGGGYKLYIGHHSQLLFETVLYAVPK